MKIFVELKASYKQNGKRGVLWQSVMFAKASIAVQFVEKQANVANAMELGESSVHSRNQSEKIS